MNPQQPTIAFTIGMFNAIDGPAYCVYTQAYGLEMTMDDEWPVNTIIMAPPHLVSAMTDSADVASMGAIPGASYTPGNGDYQQIVDSDGRWVLALPSDDTSRILAANLGVLLVIEGVGDLDALPSDVDASNFIVAFQINSITEPKDAQKTALAIRSRLAKSKAASAQILVSASFEHENMLDYGRLEEVSGLLLLDASYDRVIELITKMVG